MPRCVQRPVGEVKLADVQDLPNITYPQLIQGLQSVHSSTHTTNREEQRNSEATVPAGPSHFKKD